MKKKFRILSLVLSFVLLLITASPAFAYSETNPPPSSRLANRVIGTDIYQVNGTLLEDNYLYHYYLEDAYYNPNTDDDIVFEGDISANTKIWCCSAPFNALYRTNIESICSNWDLTAQYGNRPDSYYYTIDQSYPKDGYTVVLTCYQYSVSVSIDLGGGGRFTQTERMPVVNGDYIFLDGGN